MGKFLNKVIAAINLSYLETETRKILNQFWRNDHLPLPKFRIVNTPNAKWLGRTVYRSDQPETTIIELQKRILNDETTLKRTLEHELIHHRDFMKNPLDPTKKAPRNPHAESFMKEARRINSRMGKDYVTKVSDQSYVLDSSGQEIEVVLYDNKGRIGFATLVHPNSEQKHIFQNLMKTNRVRVIKTKDRRFLRGPALGAEGRFMILKDKNFQKYLRELFKGGTKAV